MREIEINVKKDISGLAGFELGKALYNNHNLDDIDTKEKALIIFPNTVEKVAASFVQGFFAGFIEKKGKFNAKQDLSLIHI